jgi:dATP/dGTP diphosphohydrolase
MATRNGFQICGTCNEPLRHCKCVDISVPFDASPSLDPKGEAGKQKPQLHLVPSVALVECAKALKCGADKYTERNWANAEVCQSTYLSAILRHVGEIQDGEDIDPESGASHLGHIMANCAILLDARKCGTLVDDRVLPVKKST